MTNNSNYSRRHFLKDLALGGGGLIVLGTMGFKLLKSADGKTIRAISVNFEKCAGCRTCETACSAFNHRELINGEELMGLGNPNLSNIKVFHFNPDVDVPSTCAICPNPPCINACVVSPDVITGRKALYRNTETFVIENDIQRCIGCGQCAEACSTMRGGVIYPNPETNKPERMCQLCNGDPQCVKYCPFNALEYIEMPTKRDLENLSPQKIAEKLMKQWYNINA